MHSKKSTTETQSRAQREEILSALEETVKDRFYDHRVPQTAWTEGISRSREQILDASSPEEFEREISRLLSTLASSHVGFYHSGLKRTSAKMALCATYASLPFQGSERWIFQDVHEGGPAARAGLSAGDVLVAIDGRPICPPEHPTFSIPSIVKVTVICRGLEEAVRTITIPQSRNKKDQLPCIEPMPLVSRRRLSSDTGYVRVAMYPGDIGVDVANEMSSAVNMLGDIKRLIVDLRGNTGGGVAFLRLLSLLTPDRLPVATFHKGMRSSTTAETANRPFVLDRIPHQRWQLYPLAVRFFYSAAVRSLLKERLSISLLTEGLGKRSFHGRVVLLVNRHTASGNELLITAARMHGLATIVGEPTPGRVLGGEKFRLPYGYWVTLPVGSFQTADRDTLEGQAVPPDVFAPFDPDAARQGQDTELDKALEIVSAL
jgi:C-terminal processing protease CtpA/Prc